MYVNTTRIIVALTQLWSDLYFVLNWFVDTLSSRSKRKNKFNIILGHETFGFFFYNIGGSQCID